MHPLPFVFFLAFILSGCITTSAHTKEGDNLLAELAGITAKNSEILAIKFQEAQGVNHQAHEIARDTAKHAQKDPAPQWIRAGQKIAGSILEHPASGPLGIVGTLALTWIAQRKKREGLKNLVQDLATEPDPEKNALRLKGVKI